MNPAVLDVSRWQFAITIAFHMTFPAITVGLSVFLAVVYAIYLRTRKPLYLQIFRFWRKIFTVGFALGVVAGTVITFEFGLNWGPFAHATGPVLGPIIAMEVVTAFFVEAGFIGIMIYGDGRVSERLVFVSTVIVALGTLLSTTWILAANSWMQTPTGARLENGQFVPTDWMEAIVNPAFVWRYPHMLLAVLISASWLIAGIAAYYLVRGRAVAFARRTFSLTLGVLMVLMPFQLMIGDQVAGKVVAKHQLSKLEAFEGNWDSLNTGYNLFVIPDQDQQRNAVILTLPEVGSWISKDFSGNSTTPGLAETPVADQPNMVTTFWGFRIMFYASMLMFAATFCSLVARLRKRLYRSGWLHRWVMWMTPIGIVAILGGWILAETGRQPWVVYGVMRTADGLSHISLGSAVFSLVCFASLYLVMLAVYVGYVVRTVRRGPEEETEKDSIEKDSAEPGNSESTESTAETGTESSQEPVREQEVLT